MTAVGGVAAFADLSINMPGTGYVLTASTSDAGTTDSAAFNVTPFTFTMADVRDSLRWSAGISAAPPGYLGRYDVVANGIVDLRDAVRICRKAVGLEANP